MFGGNQILGDTHKTTGIVTLYRRTVAIPFAPHIQPEDLRYSTVLGGTRRGTRRYSAGLGTVLAVLGSTPRDSGRYSWYSVGLGAVLHNTQWYSVGFGSVFDCTLYFVMLEKFASKRHDIISPPLRCLRLQLTLQYTTMLDVLACTLWNSMKISVVLGDSPFCIRGSQHLASRVSPSNKLRVRHDHF